MKPAFSKHDIPRTRIATFDVYSVGMARHHVAALLEFDVTDNRKHLKELRKKGENISFNGWLISVIGQTLAHHPEAAAYLFSKKKLILFDDINVAFLVEKSLAGSKVPIPLVIEKADKKSASEISLEIEKAKNTHFSENGVVINQKPSLSERIYYHLPGFLRRAVWRFMLSNPKFAFRKMGNVSVTSVGMIGKINGWFIHKSVHPLSFGVGSIIRKPLVVDSDIKIREVLNMTILIDHDVIDGAQMVRLLNDLTRRLEEVDH